MVCIILHLAVLHLAVLIQYQHARDTLKKDTDATACTMLDWRRTIKMAAVFSKPGLLCMSLDSIAGISYYLGS